MRIQIFSGALALSTLFSGAALADGRVLTPRIQGEEFRIECERDFPNGQPTTDFLGRLDSHIHGAPQDESGDTFNLYEHPDGRQIIEDIVANLSSVHSAIVRASMNDLLDRYDAAPDKAAFLEQTLQNTHQIGSSFYDQVAMRCDG